jgi:hypothetical protein
MRFDVSMAVSVILWVVMPHNVEMLSSSVRLYPDGGSSRFLWNVGNHLYSAITQDTKV